MIKSINFIIKNKIDLFKMSNTEKDKLKTSDIKTDEDKNVEQIYEFNPIEKEKIESKTDIKNDLMENDEIEENMM